MPELDQRSLRSLERALSWIGERVDDVNGTRIGRVETVLVDRESGRPQWLTVRLQPSPRETHAVVPLNEVIEGGGRAWVPYSRSHVRNAPSPRPDGALTARAERDACSHYGLDVTRGARQSRWERRATSSVVRRDRRAPLGVVWVPAPRGFEERAPERPRRREVRLPPIIYDVRPRP